MKLRELLWLFFLPGLALASTTTTKQLDAIQNSTGGSALSVPSVGTTLDTNSNALTLTNKIISGSSNTLSNVPVAASLVQEIPSGTCNGSTTAFTLANTPGGSSSVFLTLDGIAMIQGSGKDYTISGASITLLTACATGQTLYAIYSKY
jgi:hypothetical protein